MRSYLLCCRTARQKLQSHFCLQPLPRNASALFSDCLTRGVQVQLVLEPLEQLQIFHGHHGGDGFAVTFEDDPLPSECDIVQNIGKLLPSFGRWNASVWRRHGPPPHKRRDSFWSTLLDTQHVQYSQTVQVIQYVQTGIVECRSPYTIPPPCERRVREPMAAAVPESFGDGGTNAAGASIQKGPVV